jgi:multicomponent K+:H+ antiporter subunit A
MPDGFLLTILTALPFLGMLAAPCIPAPLARNAAAILAGSVALLCFAITLALYSGIADGGVAKHEIAWLPDLGLNIVLRLNGLSWIFAVMIEPAASR